MFLKVLCTNETSLKLEMFVSRNSICEQMFEVNYTFPIMLTMFSNSLGYCITDLNPYFVSCQRSFSLMKRIKHGFKVL